MNRIVLNSNVAHYKSKCMFIICLMSVESECSTAPILIEVGIDPPRTLADLEGPGSRHNNRYGTDKTVKEG